MAARNQSNEIKLTRVYDAPVAAVWDAWTDPKQVAQWWGPRGFTITTHSRDLRPGGHWNYTMHGPDGVDYPNTTKYHEVLDRAKLVYDHSATETTQPLFKVTVLFSDTNGKTTMEMTMTLASPEAAQQTRQIIKKHGGNSTWDRLGEFLEKGSTGKEKFVINRTFDCPLELMWQMWNDPAHFSQWLPPTGATMEFVRVEMKPGGTSFYVMTTPAGKMYGRCEYKQLEKPIRLVYIQQFCDENEKITRHPMAPTWPENMLTTVQLTAEGADQTRVTITWEPYGPATATELDTFIKARVGMAMGWTGSLDKLEEYVAKSALRG